MDPESRRLLETAVDKLGLSARAFNRILKIARTLSDLAGCDKIGTDQIAEAIMLPAPPAATVTFSAWPEASSCAP